VLSGLDRNPARRPNNPWHQLSLDVKQHCGGKGNPAKAAVARKVLIATWHVLALQQPTTLCARAALGRTTDSQRRSAAAACICV
jgi:hypothetical protein